MNIIKKIYRKQGSKVIESTKVEEKPKVTYNVSTALGALEQYHVDKDLAAYQKNLAAIAEKEKSTPSKQVDRNAIIEKGRREYNRLMTAKTEFIEPNSFEVVDHSPKRIQDPVAGTVLSFEDLQALESPVEKGKVSAEQCYFIPSQKYYLLYDNGVYICNADADSFKPEELPQKVVKVSSYANAPQVEAKYNVVTHKDILSPSVELSRAEFNQLLQSKPSFKEITMAYRLWNNDLALQMDYTKATVVF